MCIYVCALAGYKFKKCFELNCLELIDDLNSNYVNCMQQYVVLKGSCSFTVVKRKTFRMQPISKITSDQ